MIIYSYPVRNTFAKSIVVLTIILIAYACQKDIDKKPPVLQLQSGIGYTSDSLIVPIGFPYKIGILATKGDAAITNLVVTLTTENGTETALDSGMYSAQVNYTLKLSYGATRFEKWTFKLRDKNGKSASTSVVIKKDLKSAFGPIITYSSVILGSQNSIRPGSFFSINKGLVYTKEEVTTNQINAQMIFYWGDKVIPQTQLTLSSPGESDVTSYFPFISSWIAPLTEIRYKTDSLSISHSAFDASYHDSLIISNYTSATIGKRKFKMLRSGYIVPFQVTNGVAAGKRGLIKIRSIKNDADGYIIADIKVQK